MERRASLDRHLVEAEVGVGEGIARRTGGSGQGRLGANGAVLDLLDEALVHEVVRYVRLAVGDAGKDLAKLVGGEVGEEAELAEVDGKGRNRTVAQLPCGAKDGTIAAEDERQVRLDGTEVLRLGEVEDNDLAELSEEGQETFRLLADAGPLAVAEDHHAHGKSSSGRASGYRRLPPHYSGAPTDAATVPALAETGPEEGSGQVSRPGCAIQSSLYRRLLERFDAVVRGVSARVPVRGRCYGLGEVTSTLPRGTLPNCAMLADWGMRHKSLIDKVLVACQFRLCHVATVSYSRPHSTPQRGGRKATDHRDLVSFTFLAEHVGHLPQVNGAGVVRAAFFRAVCCSCREPLPVRREGNAADVRHVQLCQPLARGNFPELNETTHIARVAPRHNDHFPVGGHCQLPRDIEVP